MKQVIHQEGALFANYTTAPITMLVPTISFAALNAMWLELSPGSFKETPHDDSMDPPTYRR